MKFKITRLEDRIAPTTEGLIPSVDLTDPNVNGAEHGCPGLCNAYEHNEGTPGHESVEFQLYRHGCGKGSRIC